MCYAGLSLNHSSNNSSNNSSSGSNSSVSSSSNCSSSSVGSSSGHSNLSVVSPSRPQPMQQKVLRWGDGAAPRAVGAPLPLSRRSSNPAPAPAGAITVTASLVTSVSSLFLDNIRPDGSTVTQQQLHRKLDRSQSEPASSSAAAAAAQALKAANVNTSRYKTELCRPFEESGSCKYGDKCQFAHGVHELRSLVRHPKYKTELCRTFHSIGFCPYGPRCHFIHNAEEARNKPKALDIPAGAGAGGGSTAESPTSSLSQSPTNSICSFFPENDVFASMSPPPSAPLAANTAFSYGQDFSALVAIGGVGGGGKASPPSPAPSSPSSASPRGSPPPGETSPRLPVFNRLSGALGHVGLLGYEELLA